MIYSFESAAASEEMRARAEEMKRIVADLVLIAEGRQKGVRRVSRAGKIASNTDATENFQFLTKNNRKENRAKK